MSNQKKNIGDEAARTRKLLAKNEPNKVSGLSKRNTTLTAEAGLGPHFVVVIAHPGGTEQFTVTRPIGITDMDADKDWTIIPTDQVPATLKRKDDPSEGELNQRRAQIRTTMAVQAGLLREETKSDGTKAFYYPKDNKTPRNAHLQNANDVLKADRRTIQNGMEKAEGKELSILKQELGTLTDPVSKMDPETASAERELRKFWASPAVVSEVESKVPRTYRTLTGPFGDQSQVPISGSHGLPMQAVIDAFSKNILEMDISESPTVYVPVVATRTPPAKKTSSSDGAAKGESKTDNSADGTQSTKSGSSTKGSISKKIFGDKTGAKAET